MKAGGKSFFRNVFTVAILNSKTRKNSYLNFSIYHLLAIFIVGCFAIVLFFLISNNQRFLEKINKNYKHLIVENNLQKIKLDITLSHHNILKEDIHKLKVQEDAIKDLLMIYPDKEEMFKITETVMPDITAHRRVTKKGEIGRVLIDNKVVVEYFDSDKLPTAYRRALLTEQKLKILVSQKGARARYSIKQKGNRIYAYAGDEIIFVINESDLKNAEVNNEAKLTQIKLAKIWVKNIRSSLAKYQGKINVASRLHKLNQKNKLNQTIYTNIGYPAYASLSDSQENSLVEKDADHMAKLANQEIETYKKSFHDLKNLIESYYSRFEHTPSMKPVKNSFAHSGYGRRIHPILKIVRFHDGVDFPAWLNAPVVATAKGTVIFAGWTGGYGWSIEIDHGNGFSTFYAHNAKILIKNGQLVTKGQQIALAGDSGLAQGVHCHYEVRYFKRPVNPENFLNLNIFSANQNW